MRWHVADADGAAGCINQASVSNDKCLAHHCEAAVVLLLLLLRHHFARSVHDAPAEYEKSMLLRWRTTVWKRYRCANTRTYYKLTSAHTNAAIVRADIIDVGLLRQRCLASAGVRAFLCLVSCGDPKAPRFFWAAKATRASGVNTKSPNFQTATLSGLKRAFLT